MCGIIILTVEEYVKTFAGRLTSLSDGHHLPFFRRYLFALLCAISVSSSTLNHAEPLVSVGDTLPPWFYHEDSLPKGIVLDIFDELVKRMGHQLNVKVVPFRRIYAELLSGGAHLSVMLVSDTRGYYPPELLVGKEPLFSYRVVGAALKSRQLRGPLKNASLEQLKQFRLGHIRLLPELTDKISFGAQSTSYGNDNMMLKSLVSRRIDVAVTSEPTLFETSKRLGISDDLQVVHTLGRDRFFLVWSLTALGDRGEFFARKADEVLREMKQQGRLAEIISEYSQLDFFGEFGEALPRRDLCDKNSKLLEQH